MPAPYSSQRQNKHRWWLKPPSGASVFPTLLQNRLVGAYLFNEGAGLRIHNAAELHEFGTITGVTAGPFVPSPKFGSAMDFVAASTTHVALGTPPRQKSVVKDFTIIARVYLRDLTAQRAIYSQATGVTANQSVKSLIVQTTNGRLRYYGSDNTGAESFIESSALTVSANTWCDVALVVNSAATNVMFVKDGVPENVALSFTLTTTPDSTANARIGYTANGFFSSWDGYMEYVYVWDIALPLEEIRRIQRDPQNVIRPHPRIQFPRDPIVAIIQAVDTWRYKPLIMWREKVKPKPYTSWEGWPVPEAPLSGDGLDSIVIDGGYGAAVSADAYSYDATVVEGDYGAEIVSR